MRFWAAAIWLMAAACGLPLQRDGGSLPHDSGEADASIGADAGCGDTRSNPLACGHCGVHCPDGVNGRAACVNAECTLVCDPGWADCSGSLDRGCLDNLNSDPLHCGGCDSHCRAPMGAIPWCDAGICGFDCVLGCPGPADGGLDAGTDGGLWDAGFDGGATLDAGSVDAGGDSGTVDASGATIDAGSADAGNDSGTVDAGGATIDAGSADAGSDSGTVDAGGDAGVADSGADSGALVDAGTGDAGVQCDGGLTSCGGTCIDTSGDDANCGVCGIACLSGPCDGGSCTPGPCGDAGVCVMESLGRRCDLLIAAQQGEVSMGGYYGVSEWANGLWRNIPESHPTQVSGLGWLVGGQFVWSIYPVVNTTYLRTVGDDGGLVTLATCFETTNEPVGTPAKIVSSSFGTVFGGLCLRSSDGGVTQLSYDGVSDVAGAGSVVVWATNNAYGNAAIKSYDGDSGLERVLFSGLPPISSIALLDGNLFWTHIIGTNSGEVWTSLLDGGSPSRIAAAQQSPSSVTATSSGVFWAKQGTQEVMRFAPDGGLSVVGTSIEIVGDSTWVYFADSHGNLVRLRF